jgi:putative hydrolase of the HAD superfamily
VSFACVLLDFDGVIRKFDAELVAAIEADVGIPKGSVFHAAFEPNLLERVTTGAISRDEWVEAVADKIQSPEAAWGWANIPGTVDWELMAVTDDLRSRGTTVAVLTNGTTSISQEMADLGIDDRFDAIFNSAEIGITKPDPRVFRHVSDALEIPPEHIFFTDDSARKLAGAIEIGMRAEHYTGLDRIQDQLRSVGLL